MTVLGVVLTASQIIAYGALLGIGFWASKKITNKADEWLVMWEVKRNNGYLPELGVVG